MKPQRWHDLRLELRRPDLGDCIIAGALGLLLRLQPQVPAVVAPIVTLIALRCVRRRPVSETKQS